MPFCFAHKRSGIPFVLLLLIAGCTDPVDPEFSYREGLVYIDGFASNATGASYVQVFESGETFGRQTNAFQEGAWVRFFRESDGAEVVLYETADRYLPPEEFAIAAGERWRLEVVLSDGRRYVSEPETAVPPVAIEDVSVRYLPELEFVEDFDREVPGHQLSVTFQDPGGEENFYAWQFRSFERLVYCQVCYDGSVYRNGKCIQPFPGGPGSPNYYTYTCEEACWQIRYNESVEVYSDEFSDGNRVASLPVANVRLYQKRNILIHLQQYTLNREAYRYYKTLKDLVDNNSGLNAPLPAALLGNLYNPEDSEEYVLGRFTVAARDSRNVYIERLGVAEDQLEDVIRARAEEYGSVPDPVTTSAPCEPGPYRTDVEPQGWPE